MIGSVVDLALGEDGNVTTEELALDSRG